MTYWHAAYPIDCAGPQGQGHLVWLCRLTADDGSASMLLSITVEAPDKIVAVAASVLRMDAKAGPLMTKWLSFAASLPFQGAVPAQASDWVAEHMSRAGSTVVGDVRFTINGSAESPILEITPAWHAIAGPPGSCSKDARDCGG